MSRKVLLGELLECASVDCGFAILHMQCGMGEHILATTDVPLQRHCRHQEKACASVTSTVRQAAGANAFLVTASLPSRASCALQHIYSHSHDNPARPLCACLLRALCESFLSGPRSPAYTSILAQRIARRPQQVLVSSTRPKGCRHGPKLTACSQTCFSTFQAPLTLQNTSKAHKNN